MRISILLFAWYFVFLSCKGLGKEFPSVPIASTDSVDKDTLPKLEKQQDKDAFFNVKFDTLQTIDLPIGSELLVSHNFPEKFGLENKDYLDFFDGQRENHPENLLLSKIVAQNSSYVVTDSTSKENLNVTLDCTYFYSLVQRDTTYNKKNIKVIGKITFGRNQFVLCSLMHNQLPLYSSIFLCSLDRDNNFKDILVLFDKQEDNLSVTNELFHIDSNFIITKKYFKGFEGINFLEQEEFFTIDADGHFIKYLK